MKITVLQENLNKGLASASRIVSNKVQLPVLSNVLLVSDKGRLRLSATNLETGINLWIGAKIEEEGSMCIPAKVLAEYVASLPAEKINLSSEENVLKIECASYNASIIGLSPSEFPVVPTLDDKKLSYLKPSELSEATSQVAYAATQDESRPVLTGVFLKPSEDQGKRIINLVATDGYRLSLKKITCLEGSFGEEEFEKGLIVPGKALTEVSRMVGENDDKKKLGIAVSPGENQIIFSTSEAEVVSRLIEGDYPDFAKVIPSDNETRAILDTELFMRGIKTASIFARESANIVKVEIGKNSLRIMANTAQVGSNVSELEAKVEGKENKIAFNGRYLIDFLNSVKTERVEFQMSSALSPGTFTQVGDNSLLHVIMPVRVQE